MMKTAMNVLEQGAIAAEKVGTIQSTLSNVGKLLAPKVIVSEEHTRIFRLKEKVIEPIKDMLIALRQLFDSMEHGIPFEVFQSTHTKSNNEWSRRHRLHIKNIIKDNGKMGFAQTIINAYDLTIPSGLEVAGTTTAVSALFAMFIETFLLCCQHGNVSVASLMVKLKY